MSKKQPSNDEQVKTSKRKQQAEPTERQQQPVTATSRQGRTSAPPGSSGDSGSGVLSRQPSNFMRPQTSSVMSRQPSSVLSRQPSALLQRSVSEVAETSEAYPRLQMGGRNFAQNVGQTGSPPRVQPKLQLGPVGGNNEPATDRVARRFVRGVAVPAPALQRKADRRPKLALARPRLQRDDLRSPAAPEAAPAQRQTADAFRSGYENLSGMDIGQIQRQVLAQNPLPQQTRLMRPKGAIQRNPEDMGPSLKMSNGMEGIDALENRLGAGRTDRLQDEQKNGEIDTNSDLNLIAAQNPRSYVKNYANNNWFRVKKQYEEKQLLYSGDNKEAKVHGMDALLDYRSLVVKDLLDRVKPLANAHERKQRGELWVQNHPEEEKSLQAAGISTDFSSNKSNAAVQMGMSGDLLGYLRQRDRFLNPPPLVADAPGSTKPKSDIDVNTSGGGSEFAVQWLNKEFRQRYGEGQEPGVVYDVNFYGKDYMPGTFMDALEKRGKHERSEENGKFVEASEWQEHSIADEKQQDQNREDQTITALTMMRVNMDDGDWKKYVEKVNIAELKPLLAQAEARALLRKQTIAGEDKEMAGGDVARGVSAAALDQIKQDAVNEGLATMGAENAAYERLLVEDVAPKRIMFEMLKSSRAAPADVDSAYVAYNKAKANALMFANASYYTQGAVVGVVANKQRHGRMYKDKREAVGKDGKTAKRKLKLDQNERYQMFTEQIGFSMHGLHGHDWTWETFYQQVPDMGKYVHRAANAVKYLYGQGGDGSPGIGVLPMPLTEPQRQAAAAWEGVKQGKRKAGDDEEKKGGGYQFKLEDAQDAMNKVLRDFGIDRADQPAATVESIKTALIDLKAKVDHHYFAFLKAGVSSPESKGESVESS
jgi:hypothetical protein